MIPANQIQDFLIRAVTGEGKLHSKEVSEEEWERMTAELRHLTGMLLSPIPLAQ